MNPTQSWDRVRVRLCALERANRRLRAAFAALVAVLIFLPLLAFATPWPGAEELKAQRFVLIDAKGEARGVWAVDDDGLPRLSLRDLEGRARLELSVGFEDVTAVLRNAAGKPRLGLALDGVDNPHVLLSDNGSHPRLHLSVNSDGRSNLIVIGPKGTIDAGLGIGDDGAPWVRPAPAAAANAGEATRRDVVVPPPETTEGPAKGRSGETGR